MHETLAFRRSELQRAIFTPAEPAMMHVKTNAAFAQTMYPSAQQRGRFQIVGKHAARTADEGIHAQAARPGAQRISIEIIQPLAYFRGALGIALIERRTRLTVRQIH